MQYPPLATAGNKTLFLFLMRLAWRCRLSLPLLLSGTLALLGHAWMFQIQVHTRRQVHDSELAYYDDEEEEEEDDEEDDDSWETETTDSWETIVEETAYG